MIFSSCSNILSLSNSPSLMISLYLYSFSPKKFLIFLKVVFSTSVIIPSLAMIRADNFTTNSLFSGVFTLSNFSDKFSWVLLIFFRSSLSTDYLQIIFFKTFFPHDPETHLIWRRESKLRSYFVFLHSYYSFYNRPVVYKIIKKNYFLS